jgi:pimeloyl-ACP methyl ester carboxylesterase
MTVVFVHGNPETPAIWGPLFNELDRDDVVALALPGFGCSLPNNFTPTKEGYVAWLVEQLEAIGHPVDLVGHDWGGGFALRVAMTRPDLLRSWVTDVAHLLHPDEVWHDVAVAWQTPNVGEAFFTQMLATPVEVREARYIALGIPEPTASQLVAAANERMAQCVLTLYRSAIQPAMVQWGHDAELAAARPGLCIIPALDPYARDQSFAVSMAVRMSAQIAHLPDQRHWWMLNAPQQAASILSKFWAGLDG